MKSTAQLIVHSALRHFAQRQQHHVERFLVLGPRPVPQQEIEDGRPRKLRRPAEAAQLRIERPTENVSTTASVKLGDLRKMRTA